MHLATYGRSPTIDQLQSVFADSGLINHHSASADMRIQMVVTKEEILARNDDCRSSTSQGDRRLGSHGSKQVVLPSRSGDKNDSTWFTIRTHLERDADL